MKKVLYVSSFPTHPVRGGFQARIRAIVEYLKENKVELYFCYLDEGKEANTEAMKTFYGEEYFTVIKAAKKPVKFSERIGRGIKRRFNQLKGNTDSPYVRVKDIFPDAIEREFKKLLASFGPEVVTTNLIFLSGIFDWCEKSATKILDVHDKFADRHKVYLAEGRTPEWYSLTVGDEGNSAKRADVLMAIQDVERDYFHEITQRPTKTVGHRVFLKKRIDINAYSRAPTILFFASKGGVNTRSYEFLVNDLIPVIHEKITGLEVLVAGNINLRVDAVGPVKLLGPIDNLNEIYEQAWVVVNPAEFGTGLKIKNIEALGHGKALVTSHHGSIGLDSGAGSAFLVANDLQEWISVLVDLLQDVEKCAALGNQALAFAAKNNQDVERSLNEVFSIS